MIQSLFVIRSLFEARAAAEYTTLRPAFLASVVSADVVERIETEKHLARLRAVRGPRTPALCSWSMMRAARP
jgi:hypothetical protein